MKKAALGVGFMILMLSGCSLPGMPNIGGTSTGASFLRSSDGGVTFEPKVTIDEKTNFASSEVVSIVFNAQDTRKILLGTREDGIFSTEDSGDHWKKLNYPPLKVYGLVADSQNPNRLFATGTWQDRGKMYRSEDAGENWTEVYTEPSTGTVVTALAQNKLNPQELYAGTSAGVLIQTNDGGQTWKDITFDSEMKGQIIRSITFDEKNNNIIYFLTDTRGIFVSDGEKIITQPASVISSGAVMNSSGATAIAVDPNRSGVLYMGSSKGLFRSMDFGKTWEALNIIESSKQFPVRAIAVSPGNSNEITYISALAMYKSTDGGAHWSTYQIEGNRVASFIRYDSYDPKVMYIGFKN